MKWLFLGMCADSYGLNVARLAGVPDSVLAVAKVKAGQIRDSVEHSRTTLVRKILNVLTESPLNRALLVELQRLFASNQGNNDTESEIE